MIRFIMCAAVVCLTAGAATAQEAITAIDVMPEQGVLKEADWNRPLVIGSRQAAAGCFGAEAMKALAGQVDFEKQFLLVFAWQGSGGDTLQYTVAESFPEQVFFFLQRGLTRDLRLHMHVYALRSNVRWSIHGAGAAGGPAP